MQMQSHHQDLTAALDIATTQKAQGNCRATAAQVQGYPAVRTGKGSVCAAGNLIAEVQQYIKARVLECEECIFTASGQADAPEEPETTETGTCFY